VQQGAIRLSSIDADKSPILTKADYEALAGLRYALRRFMAFSASAAQAAGLPPQQHQALLAIKGHSDGQAMTVGVLAQRLLIAPHTAAELTGRLVRGGLVTRATDPADRRRLTLALTPKADEILDSLSLIHLKEIGEMAPILMDVLAALDRRNPDRGG
jgi:DNA-binding MarR family transcriptional regulator